MRVIGTAGHVDHGKSTLIEALTGVHPDRLKEEREREMTIELGFGWLTLPNGEEVGIVDVPGHRDFIENMLAGISGIDAALLVVAADEGVMPQTREHLAILDLLQIPAGLVVLTKTDLASDPDWLALVEADIRSALTGTVLQEAPILRVSAKTRTGLNDLLTSLSALFQQKPSRPDVGRPRLPIDRVFSMPGFGTIVTGTLSDGHLSLGDEAVVLPSGVRGRVRGLQTHKKKEQRAVPGSRTAVNISGVAVESIRRGDVLTHPGQYSPTRRLDARLRLLKDVSQPLKHGMEVKVFLGASESMAHLRLLGTERLAAGEEGWIQLELRQPVVAVRGDRYILRRPSPGETLGGGFIVDHQPKGRHKRFDEKVLKSLAALAAGSPADVLLEAALALGPASIKDVVARSRLEFETAQEALKELLQAGSLLMLEAGQPLVSSDLLVICAPHWMALQDKTTDMIATYHKNYPLRRGMLREELKSKLKLTTRVFNAILTHYTSRNILTDTGGYVALPGHEIRFDSGQQARVQELMRKFEQAPYAPPSIKECQALAGEEVYNALVELGRLKPVSAEVVFRTEDLERMIVEVRAFIARNGQMTVADARDLFNSSRKYMLPLMEFLDAAGVTVRDGDARKLPQ